ncbi:DNA repair protein RecO [Orrella sp. 11846]|uniref:DNA repair protein RecO n=1 Tax=Orrella sp. 11846 TaxID=3409913 RepID=UPI003B5B9B57
MSNRRGSTRILDAQAFVLHVTPWRETSVIAKIWSREYGLILAAAKGAKRPYSGLRTILQTFQPLRLSWAGRNEVRTLTQAEIAGFLGMPASNLMSGWYLNELILRLVPREDPHPLLFDAYEQTLGLLSQKAPLNQTLRRFEWILLREVGYGLDGPMPDFTDAADLEIIRPQIRARLDDSLAEAPLQSRIVMQGLHQIRN